MGEQVRCCGGGGGAGQAAGGLACRDGLPEGPRRGHRTPAAQPPAAQRASRQRASSQHPTATCRHPPPPAGHAQQQGVPQAERAAGPGGSLHGAQHHAQVQAGQAAQAASCQCQVVPQRPPASARRPCKRWTRFLARPSRCSSHCHWRAAPPSRHERSKIATNLKVFGGCEDVVEQTLTLFQVRRCWQRAGGAPGCVHAGWNSRRWRRRCPALAPSGNHLGCSARLSHRRCRTWRRGT